MGPEKMMREQRPPDRDPLVGEMRVRVPLPVVVPIVAAIIIAALAFGFSRVLLTVPPEAATIVAVVTSANILIACAFIALRPRMHRVSVLEVALIALYPVLIGVVIANTSLFEEGAAAEEGAPPQEAEAPPASGGDATLIAASLQFDTGEISLPAESDVVVTLDNQDNAPHNFALYETEQDGASQSGAIFQSDNVDAGSSLDLEFTSPAPGDYYFQCDIHPSMNGTAAVE